MTAPTAEQWTDAVDWLKRLVISDSHRSDRAQTILDALAAEHQRADLAEAELAKARMTLAERELDESLRDEGERWAEPT